MHAQPNLPGLPTLIIVDPRPICRAGLRALLEATSRCRIVGEATTARAGLALVQSVQPDVVVVAEELPDGHGLPFAWSVRQARPGVGVVLQCARARLGELTLVEALKYGVCALLPADASAEEIAHTLASASAGEVTVAWSTLRRTDVGEAARWTPAAAERVEQAALSASQASLMNMIVKGLTNAEIAQLMTMNARTVGYHVGGVLRRLAESTEPAEITPAAALAPSEVTAEAVAAG